jgi:hypothetical protein
MTLPASMVLAVVLADPVSSLQPKVTTSNESPGSVVYPELRFNVNESAQNEHEAQHGLPRRFASVIGECKSGPQAWRPALARTDRIADLGDRAQSAMQCAVDDDDEIDEGEILGQLADHDRHRNRREIHDRDRPTESGPTACHPKAGSFGSDGARRERGLDGKPRGESRQPESEESGRREMAEGGAGRQHST